MGTLIRYRFPCAWDWLAGGALSVRLSILDRLFPVPETPVDRAIREEGERLRKASPDFYL